MPETNQQREGWEEQYEDRFGDGDESGDYPSNAIKAFIKETLATEREELLGEIENMKKKVYTSTQNGNIEGTKYVNMRIESHNGALQRVITVLKEKK